MWITFNLDGMKFDLKIENYKIKHTIDDDWTKASFKFEFQDIIKYSRNTTEVFLCNELDTIRDYMHDLLNDELTEIESYECIEPDFEFVFHPKFDVRNLPNLIYAAPGHEIEDICMDMIIKLWDNGLTCNQFSTSFSRKEIEQFYLYLCLITEKIQIDDHKIISLLESRTIHND